MHHAVRAAAAAAALLGVGALIVVGVDGWPGLAIPDLGDCEAVGAGLIAQPVAAWTSLAFVPAGLWVAGHPRDRLPVAMMFAAGLVAVGLASFAGHASATGWGRDLDSLAIKAMLVPFILYPPLRAAGLPDRTFIATTLAATAILLTTEILLPATARPLLAVLAALLVWSLGRHLPTRDVAPGLALLALGAALWWLGRTDGVLCRTDTVLQAHGVWHILAAGGFLMLYRGIHAG